MAQPRYAAIADDLRTAIRNGDLAPGDKLPTRAELAERYGVSEIVIREAIRPLVTEGLVYTVRGRDAGWYVTEPRQRLIRVAPRRFRRGRGVTAYAEEAAIAGVGIGKSSHTKRTTASEHIADRLGLDVGDPVTETGYLFTVDRDVIAYSTTWEPLQLTQDTPIELPDQGPYAQLGIVERFDQIGYHVDRIDEELTFLAATETEGKTLGVTPGTGVVVINQTFRASHRVLAVSDIVYRGDRYRFRYEMDVPLPQPPSNPGDYGDDLTGLTLGDGLRHPHDP